MGLFKPVWKTSDYMKDEKAIKAVKKITDNNKLYEICMTAPLLQVRKAAVNQINDQRLLLDIAAKSDMRSVSEHAYERIRDPQILNEVMLHGKKGVPFAELIKKINDEQTILYIAHCADDTEARRSAVNALKKPDQLLEFAFSSDYGIRSTARRLFSTYSIAPELFGLKNYSITDAQLNKYIDSLIAENYGNELTLPPNINEDQLQRVYRNAKLEDLRAKAFVRLCGIIDSERLLEYYKIARDKEFNEKRCWATWREAQQLIERRIDNGESENISLLLQFVKDSEIDCDIASQCIKNIFSEKLDNFENIRNVRSEAVQSYLSMIDEYGRRYKDRGEEYAIYRLAVSIPSSEREQYGFEVKGYTDEAEDEYGRYLSHSTEVKYKGETYWYNM